MASAFFEKISSIARHVTDKASHILEINRINAKINKEYQKISDLKMQLGEHIWTRFETGDSFDETSLNICSQITACQDTILIHETELLKIKQDVSDSVDDSVRPCPVCGSPAGAAVNFCPKCGARLAADASAPSSSVSEHQFCPNCGKQLTKEQNFCSVCGRKVG